MKKFAIKKLTVGVLSVGIAFSVVQPQIPNFNISTNIAKAYATWGAFDYIDDNKLPARDDDNVVVNMDTNLKRYINEHYKFNKNLDTDLTRRDIRKIQTFSLWPDSANISSLSGLEFAENLIIFNAYSDNGPRVSIKPLLKLKELWHLNINPAYINDISNITSMNNLTELNIIETNTNNNVNNFPKNYDFITNIPNLHTLVISSDRYIDTSFVNNLDFNKISILYLPEKSVDIVNKPFWNKLTTINASISLPKDLINSEKPITYKVTTKEFYLPNNVHPRSNFSKSRDIFTIEDVGKPYIIKDINLKGIFPITYEDYVTKEEKTFYLDINIGEKTENNSIENNSNNSAELNENNSSNISTENNSNSGVDLNENNSNNISNENSSNNINNKPNSLLTKNIGNKTVSVEFADSNSEKYELYVKDVTNDLKDFVITKLDNKNVDVDIFDFNLLNPYNKNIVKSDLERTVKIAITRDLTNKDVEVYYINEDKNSLELLKSTLKGNVVEFNTNHFSKYAVVFKDKKEYNSTKDTVKKLPKTSVASTQDNNKNIGFTSLFLATLMSIFVIRKNKANK